MITILSSTKQKVEQTDFAQTINIWVVMDNTVSNSPYNKRNRLLNDEFEMIYQLLAQNTYE